jgi:hypothetical protein
MFDGISREVAMTPVTPSLARARAVTDNANPRAETC